ncbi:MAG: hypothetical protein ACOCTT_03730 [archaeon]
MANSFSQEDRELFVWNDECWLCGKKHSDCLHHILGRVSSSPLNAAPLNNFQCHIDKEHILGRTEIKREFLVKTYNYLKKQNYDLTKKDKEFIKNNKRFYPLEIINQELNNHGN